MINKVFPETITESICFLPSTGCDHLYVLFWLDGDYSNIDDICITIIQNSILVMLTFATHLNWSN